MAIGTTTAILGAAAIGAGASVYAGSQGAKAADRSTAAQVDANAQALQFQREGRDIAEGELRPYVNDGDAARGMIMSHLGLGGRTPATPTRSSALGGRRTSTGPDFGAYVDKYPDLSSAYTGLSGKDQRYIRNRGYDTDGDGSISKAEFGSFTYNEHGPRALPTTAPAAPTAATKPTPTPAQTPEQAQESAWESYLGTPYAKIGRFEADQAKDDFLALAGSQGSSLSGRTARGMAEVGEEAALRNFYAYQGALGGVADTGFSASSGIASAGQNFANNAANTAAATGAAVAQGEANRASAWRSALGDAAGWAGWAAGNINWQPSKAAQKSALAA